MDDLADAMEAAGKLIMQRKSIAEVGVSLFTCGSRMEKLSMLIGGYAPESQEAKEAGKRMAVAADCMREAANQLTGASPGSGKSLGKGWIKG